MIAYLAGAASMFLLLLGLAYMRRGKASSVTVVDEKGRKRIRRRGRRATPTPPDPATYPNIENMKARTGPNSRQGVGENVQVIVARQK